MQFDIVANDKATASMKGVEQSMEKFTTRLSANFSKLAMKAAAAYAAISKMGQVFKEGANIADEAKRLNITADLYQRLTLAADLFGTSQQELAKGFKDLNKLMDEAATKGQGPQFDALKALGFSDEQIMNREVKRIEVLQRLADAMSAVNDEEQKFAVASRVLGDKAAMALMPVLDNFSEFEDIMANATVLTDAQVQALDKTDDAIGKIVNRGTKLIQAGLAEAANVVSGGSLEAPMPPKIVSPEAASRAKALLGVGAKPEKTGVEKTGGLAVSSLQEIGGGIARGPSALENYAARTAIATETIAATTTTPAPPTTSSTDITKPNIPGRTVASVADVLKGGLPKAAPAPASDPFTTSRSAGFKRTY